VLDVLFAFERLRSLCALEVELRFVGDGPMRHQLERLANVKRLGTSVLLTGFLGHERVAHELRRAHIFCMPSKIDAASDHDGVLYWEIPSCCSGVGVRVVQTSARFDEDRQT